MKYVVCLLLLSACGSRPSNEMEVMSKDVLKAKTGIEIDVKPLPKSN